jgi:plasmid stabilization system protein ParE
VKVSFAVEARNDLRDISDVIATDSPRRAITFARDLVAAAKTIADTPLGYPQVPGYEAQGLRRRVFGPYLIFYRIEDERVDVLRILHGARDYDRILRRPPPPNPRPSSAPR